jgi:biopolymer transport protein ExbD
MASSSGDDEDSITGINVTPLVDVMLVLLVIFMVTATYIVNQSINVQLPKADTAESTAKTKNLAFTLDKSSALFLNGEPLAWEALPAKIAEEKAKDPGQTVNALIAADKETPHGAVVKLIDTVRKHGITDFAINVEAGASGP